MKFRWDNRYLHWGVTAFCVIAASMLFYYGIFHMKTLIVGVRTFLGIMAPVIYGVAIAYILSSLVNIMEQNLILPILKKKNVELQKRGKKVMRWICVLLSMAIFLFVIYALVMMILPQLIRSIMNIIYSFPYYVQVVEKWLNSFVEKGWNLNADTISMINKYSSQAQNYLTTNILPQMQDMLKNISAGVFDVFIFVKNFLIGAIVSIYILADKEVFIARSKMIVYSIMPQKWANTMIHAMRFTHKVFGGFIYGKLFDSLIIGILCYIGTTILNMPYAILISVIVGVTNIIPFFGPYLGAVPCFFLILLVNPIKGLYFIIFILILQQFDGNILGPKILGDSTGLSSFMVIVAILFGGGLFGVPGMILGVPVCAVVYAVIWNLIGHSLHEKEMPVEPETYTEIDCLDLETRQPVPFPKEAVYRPAGTPKANPNSLFMRAYRRIMKLLLMIGKVLYRGMIKVWKQWKDYFKKLQDKKKSNENQQKK